MEVSQLQNQDTYKLVQTFNSWESSNQKFQKKKDTVACISEKQGNVLKCETKIEATSWKPQ